MTKHEFTKDFAFNLRALLRIRNISQAKLVKMSGIDKGTMNRYYHGELMPTLKNVLNIAIALKCDIDELINLDEMIE